MRLSNLRSRKSHTFITIDHSPKGAYTKLSDENPFADPPSLPTPTRETPVSEGPYQLVEDDGNDEGWSVDEPEQENLPPPPPSPSLESLPELSPAEIRFLRRFEHFRRLQKYNRPNRVAIGGSVVKARQAYKKLGRRHHKYTNITSEGKPIKQKPDYITWSDLPKRSNPEEGSRYYFEPVEKKNQHLRLRTEAAYEAYKTAVAGYIDYIQREYYSYKLGEWRANEVKQQIKQDVKDILQFELSLAHEKGLNKGWYLCEGAKDTPWKDCKQFCSWPGCSGIEPTEEFYLKMEDSNTNINPSDKIPVRFPFLTEVRRGLANGKSNNTAQVGGGYMTGFDIADYPFTVHYIVNQAQELIYERRYTQAYELSCITINRKTTDIKPRIRTLDLAHLAFTAASAARFAHHKWSLTYRISEIERYLNLSVYYMLSKPAILQQSTNTLLYADVKAKVHYWGELHQLHIMMPQRSMDELVEILSNERYRRLVRSYNLKLVEKKREMKKGYTLQITSVPIPKSDKAVVSRRKGLVAKLFRRSGKGKKDIDKKAEAAPPPQGFLQKIWDKIWRKQRAIPSDEADPDIEATAEAEAAVNAAEALATPRFAQGKRSNRDKDEPDVIELLDLREYPPDEDIIWISKDGKKQRRRTPMPSFDFNRTLNKDPFQDYPLTVEGRQAMMR
ncbi:hypothetical protein TWF481_000096 [Arthrobotrys musiformis]|uniref:Uncharacterized protein n=1 Tax=Arthrobotrys musiformis TaxID=47236 RepID=A0AAV9WMH6_9PEZI